MNPDCITPSTPTPSYDWRRISDEIQATLTSWLPHGAQSCSASAALDFEIATAEREQVAKAVAKRQADFITGRWCAHQALLRLGLPAEVIAANALGGPIWPSGAVGSISHDGGMCLATVLPSTLAAGVGVDLFDTQRAFSTEGFDTLVLSPEELRFSATMVDRYTYLALLFSAKESVVKAVSDVVGRYLDMREIDVCIQADLIQARLQGFPTIHGRWRRVGPFLLTMALLAPATPTFFKE